MVINGIVAKRDACQRGVAAKTLGYVFGARVPDAVVPQTKKEYEMTVH